MAERKFTPGALEIFEMMRNPERGPLQTFWVIDHKSNSLVESSQPLAVTQEHLEGNTIVLNPDIARKILDTSYKEYVEDMLRLEELGYKRRGNYTFYQPVSAEAAKEINGLLGF